MSVVLSGCGRSTKLVAELSSSSASLLSMFAACYLLFYVFVG